MILFLAFCSVIKGVFHIISFDEFNGQFDGSVNRSLAVPRI